MNPIMPTGLDLDKLPRREALNCTPEELIETSWENEWSPEISEQT